MTLKKRITGTLTALAVCGAMTLQAVPATAHAPSKDDVIYEGNGVVDVEFLQDSEWRSPKVKVKDNKGKSYKTTIIKYDDDDIKFKIKKFKKGRTYKFTIGKVRVIGTSSFGTVKGKVRIGGYHVSASKAKKIAINHAVRNYHIKRSSVRGVKVENDARKNVQTWDVEFEAKKSNGSWYEYDYEISKKSGKIFQAKEEFDD